MNIFLLGLWHGFSKPVWHDVLKKVSIELDMLRAAVEIKDIGSFKRKLVILICDMPAKAAALNMNQFNGFSGYIHFLLTGTRVGPKLLYPCDAEPRLRDTDNFRRHAQKADKRSEYVAGIKRTSPLSSKFSFQGDALIDPMHRVFLGADKFLTKLFKSELNGGDALEFNEMPKTCMFPVDFLKRPKRVDEFRY